MAKRNAIVISFVLLAILTVVSVRAQDAYTKIGLTNDEVSALRKGKKEVKGITSKEIFKTVDGVEIEYYLYTPENKNEKLPLILYLHGSSLRGSYINVLLNFGLTGIVAKDMDIPAYVISPQLQWGKYWGEIGSSLILLIQDTVKKHNIDQKKIIITGHSLGGTGAYGIGSIFPEMFSCIIPVSGDPYDSDFKKYKDKTVFLVVGEQEVELLEINKKAQKEINEFQGKATLIVMPGGTHASAPDQLYYDRKFYETIFSFDK
jgi:predicted peptidase